MANLVEQIFQQAQSGTAQGQHLGDYYFEGKKLRQDQQRINLMERQLAQQAARDEINAISIRQDQAFKANQLEMMLKGRDAFMKAQPMINSALEQGGTLAGLQILAQAANDNPFIMFDPRFKDMSGMLSDMHDAKVKLDLGLVKAEADLLQAQAASDRAAMEKSDTYSPGFSTSVNPITGKPVAVFRTGPRSAQIVDPKDTDTVEPEIRQIKDPSTGRVRSVLRTGPNSWKEVEEPESYRPEIVPVTDPTTGKQVPVLRTGPKSGQVVRDQTESTSGFGKLVSEYNAAVKSGDKTTAQFYDAKIKKEITPTGMQIKTNPDGTIELTQGAIDPEALTKTNQTKTQESFNSELQVIDLADRLEPILDNETVGVQAWAESILKDRLLSQWLPGVSSTKRADAEVLASDLRSARIKALKTDGQIGVKEIAQIEKAVPEINAPLKSAEGQRNLVKGIRKVSAMRAAFKAKLLGVPIPPLVVFRLDDKDLAEMANNGLITRQMAIDAKKSR